MAPESEREKQNDRESRIKKQVQEHRLHSIERRIEDRSKVLEAKEKQLTSVKGQLALCCRDIDAKEIEYAVVQRSVEERKREFEVMGEQLNSLQRNIIECERQLRLKEEECNWQHETVHRLITEHDEVHRKMQRAIQQCSEDLDTKESRLCLIMDLIREREQELKTKDMEFHQLLEKKEEEHRVLSNKIAERNELLKTKDEEVQLKRQNLLKSMQERINQLVRELGSNKKQMESRSLEFEKKEKDLESMKKQFVGRLKELELKEKQFKVRVRELESKEKQFEGQCESRVRELESKEKQFEVKAKELESKEKLIEGQMKDLESKKNQHEGLVKELELRESRFKVKLKELSSKEKQLEGQMKGLDNKRNQYEGQAKELELKDARFQAQLKELESKEKRFEGRTKDLDYKKNQYEGQAKALGLKEAWFKVQMKDLESKEKQFEGQVKELESKQKHFEGQVKEFKSKQKQFDEVVKVHESKEKQFRGKVNELWSMEKQYEGRVKELESNEKQNEGRVQELKSKEKMLEKQAEELVSKEKQIERQMKDLEFKMNQYEEEVMDLKLEEAHFKAHFKVQLKELETKEKQIEGEMRDLESKKNQHEKQVMDLELKEAQFKVQLKELESKEKQIEGQMKDIEFKKDEYEGQVKQLELKEEGFNMQLRELIAKEKQIEGQMKDLELKQNQYEWLRKSFEVEKVLKKKSNILLHQANTEQQYFTDANSADNSKNSQLLFDLLEKHRLMCNQVSDALRTSADPTKFVLDTIKGLYPPHLRQEFVEYDANVLRRICNLLMDELKKSSPVIGHQVKQEAMKLAIDWKPKIAVAGNNCLEVLDFFKFVTTYGIGSSFNTVEFQRLLDIIAQPSIENPPDNKLNLSIDGRNLQFPSIEHQNEPELVGNDILVNLQTSSDPAKLVLDIIQNPIVPQNKGNGGVIIDGSHIFLLEQLMGISPHIKSNVKEEALMLALHLQANMGQSAENPLVVWGFLLLLSIYGLVSFFNGDEILKLFESAVQHKQAVQLFRTLGFEDKISDFVQNLVKKQQHIEAVRFICAFKLADKIQPVDLLRRHVAKAKRTTKNLSRRKRFDRKVMARDLEIACLGTVLQCISDNDLESKDLVNDIQCRILELKRQKEYLVGLASEAYCNVEQQLPEEKKSANEVVTKNQAEVQQHKEKKHADAVVTKNQVKVQQAEEKICASNAVTVNQVQLQNPEEEKHVIGTVTKTQVKVKQPKKRKQKKSQVRVQHPKEKICANGEATVNQVRVPKPEEKKRGVESIPNNYLLHQWGNNNKRPRTAVTSSVPSVFTPQYQHGFMPMPPRFGLPANYFCPANPMGIERFGNGGANSFGNSWPYPPF